MSPKELSLYVVSVNEMYINGHNETLFIKMKPLIFIFILHANLVFIDSSSIKN